MNNLEFAKWMEPENTVIQQQLDRAIELTRANKLIVPGSLAMKKLINLFMRVGNKEIEPLLREKVKQFLPADEANSPALHAIREAKNAGIHQNKA